MVKVEVSFQMSPTKRNLWWPSNISFCIPMTIWSLVFRNWRLPGLGQITWWIVMTKIMRGHSRKQILQKSRNSCRVNGQGCVCIGKVHSRCNFLQSWTKYKLSKNIFAVTNFALIIGRDWAQLLQLFVRYLIEIPVPLLAVSTPIFVGQWFLD